MQSIQALTSLPQEIRLWLASEETADQLRRINAELDLHEEETRLIPYLLFRLAVKDLEPLNFVETLSDWLDISPSSANTIAGEIKDRVLGPVSSQLRSWGIEISLIRPIELESRPPLVATPPPPPPLPPAPPAKDYAISPPIIIKPEPVYEPPPPPAMGGRFDVGGAGAAGRVSEKQPERKGRVHIIGDAHEHSADETSNIELRTANEEQEREEKNKLSGAEQKVEKKIRLPIPLITKKSFDEARSQEEKPLILHQETTILPVVKEQEWLPPKPKTAPPTESPRVNKTSPKDSLLPPSGIRVVHYDENVTPLAESANQEARIKNKDEELKGKKPEPIRPHSPPTLGGPNIKGNTVDLR